MKKTAYMLVIAVLVLMAPAFAQGPFNDVPTDHWAYDAVNTLQKDGIVIGYPDGTFGGKRAMSRYEFATAIARILPMLQPDTSSFATKAELAELKNSLPDFNTFATKADVDALKKLVDEFRDELAALGVDVDALKRDVAALCARVDALEAEQKRVRFTGDVNVFGITTSASDGDPIDLDQRNLGAVDAGDVEDGNRNVLLRNIGVVQDFDLTITGRVSQTTTAVATINYGNYLNYLSFVDDYVGGFRPTSNDFNAVPTDPATGGTLADNFFPYYLYINTGLCKGSITVGRFPIQWTPYTLKKIDVDSYTTILKTDDGNYPMDGIKAAYNFGGGVDVAVFAAKNNQNDFLLNGLTGQPTLADANFTTHELGGHSVGGLVAPITQSAGVRATIGTPWKGVLGLTYYQAWSEPLWSASVANDQAQVYGADLNIPIGEFGFVGSWTKSNALANDRVVGAIDVDDDNNAWDGRFSGTFGKLNAAAGYKQIERNFAAAGAWDKIGRWTNPTNVKGPYVDFAYPIARKLKVALNGEFLTVIDNVNIDNAFALRDDDTVTKAEAGLKWGVSKSNSVDLGYQWVQWDPDLAGQDETIESYLTIGWAHQFSANAGMKIGYQYINVNTGIGAVPYGIPAPGTNGDYRGGVAVAQFGVTF